MPTEFEHEIGRYFDWIERSAGVEMRAEGRVGHAQRPLVESGRSDPDRPVLSLVLVGALLIIGVGMILLLGTRGGGETDFDEGTTIDDISSTTPVTTQPQTTSPTPTTTTLTTTTLTSEVPTTNPATITAPPVSSIAVGPARDGALLGGSVDAGTPLYFVADDPGWNLIDVSTSAVTLTYPELLIVGEGDIATRPRVQVDVGVAPFFQNLGGADGQEVRVGDEVGRGVTTIVEGNEVSDVIWPGPDGYAAAIEAVGLDLASTIALADRVTFDDLAPTIDAPAGYRRVEPSPATGMVRARFANSQAAISVECMNDGDQGYAAQQGAVGLVPRAVAGTVVALRVRPAPLGAGGLFGGAAWIVGDWWCRTMPDVLDPANETLPSVMPPDDQVEALLTSLTIVDEATLRATARSATIDIRPWPDTTETASPALFDSGGADSAQFTADGSMVVTNVPGGTQLRLIDAEDGTLLQSFETLSIPSCGSRVSADGRLVFDGASIRDARSRRQIASIMPLGQSAYIADFSPDGQLLAVFSDVGQPELALTVYDTATGATIATSGPLQQRRYPDGGALSPRFLDGQRIFISGPFTTAAIWDIDTGRTTLSVDTPQGYSSARISPDGRWIAVNPPEEPGNVPTQLIDTSTGDLVLELPRQVGAFSSDGSLLALKPYPGSGGFEIWSTETLTHVVTLPAHSFSMLGDTSFSPDGTRIVALVDGVGEVRDTTTGALIGRLDLGQVRAFNAAFSPDGTGIVTANTDGTIRVWPAP